MTYFKMLLATTVVAGAMAATAAQATPTLEYSLNGGAFNTFGTASGNTVSFNGSLGDFQLNLSGTSNTPGTPTLSELLSSTLSVLNTGNAIETISFLIVDTGFVTPTAPSNLLLNSHIGGSVAVSGAGNLLSFTSSVAPGTNPFGAGATSAGPGTPNITNSSQSFNDDKTSIVTSLAAPYSIGQEISITLSSGSQINYANNTTLAPVPEPTSLALFGTSLLGLGLVGRKMRNRRKA